MKKHLFLLLLLAAPFVRADDDAQREALQFFEKEVRPLLAQRCYDCHGEKKKKGSLRLDNIAYINEGGDSGPALVPGKPDDSLIVNLDLPGGGFFMPLFVKLRDGLKLDDELREKVRARMRKAYSARHVPDKIYQVKAIPYTLTGKKMEVPVRRILTGVPVEKAANRAAMSNVESLDFFLVYAREQRDYRL